MRKFGDGYDVRNFGAGSTTVTLASETPYMDSITFPDAIDFKPNIVIIMLGTNDAQPSLFPFKSTFTDDYLTLIRAFQKLPTHPEIWLVLPPPIFSDRGGIISPEYFEQTILPGIKQAANEANLPVIDVYSLLIDYPEYFPDGIHPDKTQGKWGNEPAAQIIATAIHKAITSSQSLNARVLQLA
jgi:lysophospholipase L1-like esterase